MDGTYTNGDATKERPAEPTTYFGWDHKHEFFEEFFSKVYVTLPNGQTHPLALPRGVMVSVNRGFDAADSNILRLIYPRKQKKPLSQILVEWSEFLLLALGILIGAGLYRNLAYYLGW